MTDQASSVVEAIKAVGGVITELVQIAERLPVRPGEADPAARILDRLAEQISEAAQLLRSAADPITARAPTLSQSDQQEGSVL